MTRRGNESRLGNSASEIGKGQMVDHPAQGSHALAVAPEFVEALASRVADLVVERLPQQPEPYLNVGEAAEYLAAPKSRIYEIVERRAVAVHRDGRRLLFRRSDLDAYLHRDEVG